MRFVSFVAFVSLVSFVSLGELVPNKGSVSEAGDVSPSRNGLLILHYTMYSPATNIKSF